MQPTEAELTTTTIRDQDGRIVSTRTTDDPYARRFRVRGWTIPVDVRHDHRVFPRLPEFAGWTKAQHEHVARAWLTEAVALQRVHHDAYQRLLAAFGPAGSEISGGFRASWPDVVKDSQRARARQQSDAFSKSLSHWRAAGKTRETWIRRKEELIDQEFARYR